MRKVMMAVLSLMITVSAFGQDNMPLVFRCQADSDKPVEVKICKLMAEGLDEYDMFYKPDYETENVALFIDVAPLQHMDEKGVSAGVSASVIVKKNDSPVPVYMFAGIIITDTDKMDNESWDNFWHAMYEQNTDSFKKAEDQINSFCKPTIRKRGALYAWTETSTCVSMTTALRGSGALGTQPPR